MIIWLGDKFKKLRFLHITILFKLIQKDFDHFYVVSKNVLEYYLKK